MKPIIALFVTSALAAPGFDGLFRRAQCNANNCLRAVRASSASPFPSSATKDCSSFQQTTVTPCPVTTTVTTSVTVTGTPVSTTTSTTVGTTSTTIITSLIELTTTTVTQSTVTETSLTTSIETVTAVAKRDVLKPLPPAISRLVQLDARTVIMVCSATSASSSVVPKYASACSGTSAYSSACFCAGITAAKTTLAPQTVTATSTSTITVTPTSTLVSSATSVSVSTIITTVSITDMTVTSTSLTTTTTTLVVFTTSTAPAAVCSSYRFVVTSGDLAGTFITGPDPAGSTPYGFITFGSSAASAIPFTIRPDTLVYGNNVDRWITQANQIYYILQSPDNYASIYNIDNVLCTIGQGDSAYPGAVGTLSCTTGGHSFGFYQCASTGNDVVQGTDDTVVNQDCTQYTVAAILAC